MKIAVQEADFDVSAELAQLRSAHVGAIVSFVGLARDVDGTLNRLELEHYPGMTEKALQHIVNAAQERWKIIDATVIHRVGALALSDQIVLVAVACQHRGEAFAACEFIIDYLKTEAAFWKKEVTDEGAKWVDARESDAGALKKWDPRNNL